MCFNLNGTIFYQSVQAITAKDHRLHGLSRNVFSYSSGDKESQIKVPADRILGFLACRRPHSCHVFKVGVRQRSLSFSSSSYKATVPLDQDATLMTSFNLKYLLKTYLVIQSQWELDFNMNLGETQFIFQYMLYCLHLAF